MSNDVQAEETQQPDLVLQPDHDKPPEPGAIRGVLRYGLISIAAIAVIMTSGWVFWNQAASRQEVPKAGVDYVIPVYEPPATAQPALATAASAGSTDPEPSNLNGDSASVQTSSMASDVVNSDDGVDTGTLSEPLVAMAMPAVDMAQSPSEGDAPVSGQTESLQSDLVAVVRGRRTILSANPGGEFVQYLPTGEPLTATGRSADGAWIYVQTFDGTSGWLELDQIVIFNAGNLLILDETQEGPRDAEAEPVALSVDMPVTAGAVATQPPVPDTTPESQMGPVHESGYQSARLLGTIALSESRLNVRTGPGTQYAIVAKANPGESYPVLARNRDGGWVQIELPDDLDQIAWVSAEYIKMTGSVDSLPFSESVDAIPPVTQTVPTQSNRAGSVAGLSGNLAIQSAKGGMIHVYSLDSGALRPLTSGYDPAISPDGLEVAFVRDGGESGIYLINIDGSDERRIFGGRDGLRSPSWSPDGQSIVFVHAQDSYKCREVGLGICLPDNNPFLDSFPVGSQPWTGLSQIDVNGDNYRDLPALPTAQAPNWGDGGIVYSSAKSIEITEPAPGGDTRFVVGKDFYQDPDWRSDGEQIVFQSREGTHWEIFVVKPDGGGLVPLTKPQSVLVDVFPHNVAPTWSPDGQRVAYLSNRDNDNEAGEWRVWVMNADGSDQYPLPVDIPLDYHYANEQVLNWGPPA